MYQREDVDVQEMEAMQVQGPEPDPEDEFELKPEGKRKYPAEGIWSLGRVCIVHVQEVKLSVSGEMM